MPVQTPEEASQLNAEIIEALMADVEGAVTHGGAPKLREVVHQGDEEFPAPVVAKVYADAGVRPIWDRRTGEQSLTSINLLPAQLRKLGADGQRMFTAVQPATTPTRGAYRCLLHTEERKPEYDTWGLPTCRKANLTSPLQVEQHMAHRHKVEWATIQREQEKREKEEDRAIQRQIAAAAIARPPAEPVATGKRAS